MNHVQIDSMPFSDPEVVQKALHGLLDFLARRVAVSLERENTTETHGGASCTNILGEPSGASGRETTMKNAPAL